MDKLCDPTLSGIAEVTDLMICAPWATATFACLTNGVDHTACCRARGLPDLCQELCTGNVTQLDFSYFKYAYTTCLFISVLSTNSQMILLDANVYNICLPARELHPSSRGCLSAKLMSTFLGRWFHMVSAVDPHSR